MSKSLEPEQIIYNLIKGYLQHVHPGMENIPRTALIVSEAGQESGINLYNIKLFDSHENEDQNHKEIPKVPANNTFLPGDKVAVLFLYQDAGRPYIVGKHP